MALFRSQDLKQVAADVVQKSYRKNATQILHESITSFSENVAFNIFLSHRYTDHDEVLGIKTIIEEYGCSVYIDWIDDKDLERSNVTRESVQRIRNRLLQCKSLLFAYSESAEKSLWIPWELGFVDGAKDKVAILPISSILKRKPHYVGQEYLKIYPFIDIVTSDTTGHRSIWVNYIDGKYDSLKKWIG